MLNEMPVSVKDKIGVLRDFKFAKLADETILIVGPAKRRIVDIVSRVTEGPKRGPEQTHVNRPGD